MYPFNSVPNLTELVDCLYFSTAIFSTTYLGLPLGVKFRAIGIWLEYENFE